MEWWLQPRARMRFALVVALGIAACNTDPLPGSGDCMDHVTTMLTLPRVDPRPPVQLQMEKCWIDREVCDGLCRLALKSRGIDASITACEVAFDSQVLIALSYDKPRNDFSCPQPDFANAGSGMGGVK